MTKNQFRSYIEGLDAHSITIDAPPKNLRRVTIDCNERKGDYLNLFVWDSSNVQCHRAYRLECVHVVILWKMKRSASVSWTSYDRKIAEGWDALRRFEEIIGRSFMNLDILIP